MKSVYCTLALLWELVGAQQCYWPDGTNAAVGYVACNATATASACCDFGDACTTKGWCLGKSEYVYRGGCTDKTWSSGVCQQKCKLTNAAYYQNLYPCSGGASTTNFCCGDPGASSSCCSNNFSLASPADSTTGVAFMPAAQAFIDLGIGTTISTSPVMSTTVTTLATETTRSCGSSGVAAGGVAGAAIGSAVAGIAVGLLAGCLVWRKPRVTTIRQNNRLRNTSPKITTIYPGTVPELDSVVERRELPGERL